MLLYFGVDKSRRKVERLYQSCSSCKSHDSIHLGIFQKYFHLYKLPCFPLGKSGATQCDKCRVQVEDKDFSGEVRYQYETLKSNTATPIWTFSGVALLLVLIATVVISVKENSNRNSRYISSPQVGDIYEVKFSYSQYTLFKVQAVVDDTVYVFAHQYETDQSTGLLALKRKGDEAYIEEALPILKSELKAKFDSGEIMEVDRE